MPNKSQKAYTHEFKVEAVRLITSKGYIVLAETSRNLGVEYSVLRRWKQPLSEDPENASPKKGQLKT